MITMNAAGWHKVKLLADEMIAAHKQYLTAEEAVAHVQSLVRFDGPNAPSDQMIAEYLMTIWITVDQCKTQAPETP